MYSDQWLGQTDSPKESRRDMHMRKVGTVIASLSRNAGGLFESVRNLSLSVDHHGRFENAIFGLRDEYTDSDVGEWQPLDVTVQRVYGPRVFGYAPSLLRDLTHAGLDVIHNHGIWMYPSWAVRRSAHSRATPYVVSPHGMLDPWAVKHSHWKKVIAQHAFEGAHLKEASCIRALCESEAESTRAYGLRNPICVIPNGIHLPDETPTPRPACLSHIPPQTSILLYLGRIHPKKGLPNLLKAWENSTKGEWHLVIAGWDQGKHLQELTDLAGRLNIKNSVSFVGPQFGDAKRALYQHSQAFILPSFSEGLPMVVLEAWSHRLPVVMTPACNLPSGFDSACAVRIETDPDSIRQGLRQLMNLSTAARGDMGRRGRALVEQKFTWHTIGAQMCDVYDWLLGSGRPTTVRLD